MSNVVAGIDACRGGWFGVLGHSGRRLWLVEGRVLPSFAEAVAWVSEATEVAVDVPIGLKDRGVRECDLAARRLLGPRWMCVFHAPPRPVLSAKTYGEAAAIYRRLCGQGMTRQSFGIMPKIAEVDAYLGASPARNESIWEIHPEVSFAALNQGKPLAFSKHAGEGLRHRRSLLEGHTEGLGLLVSNVLRSYPRAKVKIDDVLDAVVACVTAGAWEASVTIPRPEPPRDSWGLKMEMRVPRLGSVTPLSS